MRLDVARVDRLVVAGVADHDLAEALLEVLEARREAEDRHDFRGDDGEVNASRRSNRRFVHVKLDVDDIRRLGEAAPFAWSTYDSQT